MMPRLRKRLAPVTSILAALLVAVSCSGEAASSADGEGRREALAGRPNLLVVTIDTLRSSALGSYGSLGGHTPHLDGLAAEGVVFEPSQAPMATTFPSHSSMFTGLFPRTHGVGWNGHTLDDDWTTLAGTRPGDEAIALAADWLDRQGDQPFMLWVHLFEPHSPYPVTEYAAEIMGDDSGSFYEGMSHIEQTINDRESSRWQSYEFLRPRNILNSISI
ncbi:MAG: arylsulfatase A-like enzyme [Pseudohongiellaceae bacterium]|jgi:arylsulfatase A-like enzyme